MNRVNSNPPVNIPGQTRQPKPVIHTPRRRQKSRAPRADTNRVTSQRTTLSPRRAPNPGLSSSPAPSSCEESWRPLQTRAPCPSTQQPYKRALQCKPLDKEVHAFFKQQWAPERNATKVAPQEDGLR
ncbi:hypothetical protein MRX96_018838 [Rhipicephalus microplus]